MIGYYVIKHPKGWAFRKHGGLRALWVHCEKRKVVSHAKEFLKGKGYDLVVHDKARMVERVF